jgi:Fe-S cluster assembly protein SufD
MLLETIKKDFIQYKAQAEPGNFLTLREAAFAEFEKLGFPTTKHEEWKYTNLKSITDNTFQSTCEIKSLVNELFNASIESKLTANFLVFVNGSLVNELSKIIEQDKRLITPAIRAVANENEKKIIGNFLVFVQ